MGKAPVTLEGVFQVYRIAKATTSLGIKLLINMNFDRIEESKK